MSTAAISHVRAKEVGHDAVLALNQAALLRDVLVREIRALGALYVVGKRRPVSELPPEKQEQVRRAYESTQWASDYGIELICVCTSHELAERVCRERGPNYFLTRLPIDSPLPDETVFGEWAHTFPGSEVREVHENLQAATIAVPVSQVRALKDEIQRLQEQIDSIRGT